MIDTRHALLIPPEGVLELLASDLPIDIPNYLSTLQEGPVVYFDIDVDGERDGRLVFINAGAENPRARGMLVNLTGVHMQITGPAIFVGLSPERVVEAMREIE